MEDDPARPRFPCEKNRVRMYMKYLVHILRSETICVMMKKEPVLYPPSQIDKSHLQTSVPRFASIHSQGIGEGALHRLRSFHRAG